MQALAADRALPTATAQRSGAAKQLGCFKKSVRGTRVQHKARSAAAQPGLLQTG